MTDFTQRPDACYSDADDDGMRDRGCAGLYSLRQIRAVDPGIRVFGRAFTLRGTPDDAILLRKNMKTMKPEASAQDKLQIKAA